MIMPNTYPYSNAYGWRRSDEAPTHMASRKWINEIVQVKTQKEDLPTTPRRTSG